jgi:hypothetical protein
MERNDAEESHRFIAAFEQDVPALKLAGASSISGPLLDDDSDDAAPWTNGEQDRLVATDIAGLGWSQRTS